MSNKLATIEVQVPFKASGGIINQHQVRFDVFQIEDHYQLKPCLSEDERRVANLPEELLFTIEEGKAVSMRGKMDSNLHVIQDAVTILQEQNILT